MYRAEHFMLYARLPLAFSAVAVLTLGGAILGGTTRPLPLGLIGAALLCGAALAYAEGRSAQSALANVTAFAQALADGRLEGLPGAPAGATFAPLVTALETLCSRLRTEHDNAEKQREQLAAMRDLQPRESPAPSALLSELHAALNATRETVEASISGDLTRRLDTQYACDELRAMGDSVNALIENMGMIVHGIRSTAGEVKRAADEITVGNENLSQRTEEQSTSLEETASSMEQMTTTVKQNADNAAQANQLAVAARAQAERGGVIVNQAIAAMSDINQSSKKIADIIGVIDEIAFQTNLLALNAAVEAARAGEQGRGFAVVASEVRSLAGRSATAAKEIKALIQDSVRKVEDGSSRVTQSGQTLEEIVASVKRVSDIVAEIAAASREQSAGIEQVNRAVMQMDELTQQNATLVEHATTAARNMSGLAAALDRNMARYHLGEPARAYAGEDAPLRRSVGG